MKTLVSPVAGSLVSLRSQGVREYVLYAAFLLLMSSALVGADHLLAGWSIGLHLTAFLLLTLAGGGINLWLTEVRWFADKPVWMKGVINTAGAVAAIFFFGLLSWRMGFGRGSHLYGWVFLPALVLLALPWWIWRWALAIAAIPPLVYDPVGFDSLKEVLATVRWTEDDARGIRWVFLDDFTEVDPSGIYQFRTHTPNDVSSLELQFLFKSMLSLHNHNEHPKRPVHFLTDKDIYGWQFYRQRTWIGGSRLRSLDPRKNLRENGVRFRRLSREERQKVAGNLHPKFRAATIFITRTQKSMPS